MKENPRTFSRRKFLIKSAVASFAAVSAGETGKEYFFGEQNDIWNKAGKENDEFLSENQAALSHIKFGTSFSPEMFGDLSLRMLKNDPVTYRGQQQWMLKCLDIIINEFDIKDIRLGIRWDNAVANNRVDLSVYRPVIDKCIENGVNITLNFGAIKTFRWPEEHVPKPVLVSTPAPIDGIVTPDDEVAKHATGYLQELMGKLISTYGEDAQRRIVKIQPENEGFNRFGTNKWKMSDRYYRDVISISRNYFPNAAILINSASGGKNLGEIDKLFTGIVAREPDLKNKLVAGIDFHYDTPNTVKLPGVHPGMDPITVLKLMYPFGEDDLSQHQKFAPILGIRTEITEGQMEAYGKHFFAQEESRGMRFWVLRTAPFTDQMLYIWGSEVFAKKALAGTLTRENKKNIELIHSIQQRPAV